MAQTYRADSHSAPGGDPDAPPPAPAPDGDLARSTLSVTKSFRPYYSPPELVHLVRLQAASRADASRQDMSESRIETWRQLACGYIERVGARLGLSVPSVPLG